MKKFFKNDDILYIVEKVLKIQLNDDNFEIVD